MELSVKRRSLVLLLLLTLLSPAALSLIYGSVTGTMSNVAPSIAAACSALLRAPQQRAA